MLGGTLLGATVIVTPGTPVDADILVRPAGPGWREAYPAQAGCAVLACGGPPESSSVEGFEAALWSGNPVAPPESVDPETPTLRVDGETHTHGDLRATAAAAADRLGLDPSSRPARGRPQRARRAGRGRACAAVCRCNRPRRRRCERDTRSRGDRGSKGLTPDASILTYER